MEHWMVLGTDGYVTLDFSTGEDCGVAIDETGRRDVGLFKAAELKLYIGALRISAWGAGPDWLGCVFHTTPGPFGGIGNIKGVWEPDERRTAFPTGDC